MRLRPALVPMGLVVVLLTMGCADGPPPPEGADQPETADDPEVPDGAGARLDDGGPPGWPRTLRDQAGRSLELSSPPARIVSLVPAATSILVELGELERLVGRTDFDDPSVMEGLPSVGGGLNPSIEHLVSLGPDLVVRFEGEQDRSTPQALDRADIPHLAVRPDRIADIRKMALLLGQATGREEAAHRLVDRMEEELDVVRARVAHVRPPRVAFLLGGDPPWVVGPGTFLHELLELAGGENALAQLERPLYAPVSVEEILRQEVDLILALEDARIPSALGGLPVARLPEGIQSPGIEVGRSAREISRRLHPGQWQ